MSNKEIVANGLQARKDVKAATTRAEKFREAAASVHDARFHDRCRYENDRREWQEEKAGLEQSVLFQRNAIKRLVRERDELLKREHDGRQRRIIVGVVKAIFATVLLSAARDLGWVVAWLATGLLVASAVYMCCAIVKLARGAKK